MILLYEKKVIYPDRNNNFDYVIFFVDDGCF